MSGKQLFGGVSGQNARATGNPLKLAAEYALYMMARERQRACQIGLSGPKPRRSQTLTIWGFPPIRPRFLEMDEILNPRAADQWRVALRGWKRIFCDVAAL